MEGDWGRREDGRSAHTVWISYVRRIGSLAPHPVRGSDAHAAHTLCKAVQQRSGGRDGMGWAGKGPLCTTWAQALPTRASQSYCNPPLSTSLSSQCCLPPSFFPTFSSSLFSHSSSSCAVTGGGWVLRGPAKVFLRCASQDVRSRDSSSRIMMERRIELF